MVRVDLLLKELQELGVTKKAFANNSGMSVRTLDNKLDNPKSITGREIYRMAEALRIPIGSEKFLDIFFAPEVPENGNILETKGEGGGQNVMCKTVHASE